MNRRSGLFRRMAALLPLTLAGAACVTWAPVTEPLPEVLERTQLIRVTTVDSVTFQIQGSESETIRVEDGRLVGPLGDGTVSVPLTDIAHVEAAAESSNRRTLVFAGAVVAIGVGLLLLMGGVEVGGRP